jgi:hypothetical protein
MHVERGDMRSSRNMAPESAGASVLGLREVIARQVTMNAKLLGLITCMALLAASQAGAITYNVDLLFGSNSVRGTISTDAKLGVLSSSDITDWNLVINSGAGPADLLGPLSGNNGSMYMFGSAFIASLTTLTFYFSDTTPAAFEFYTNAFGWTAGDAFFTIGAPFYLPDGYTDIFAQGFIPGDNSTFGQFFPTGDVQIGACDQACTVPPSGARSWPHRRCGAARSDLGERWPARLVGATAAPDRVNKPNAAHWRRFGATCPHLADIVAKRFWASEGATLIQD